MRDDDNLLPSEIDTTRPTSARVYDYMVGGSHWFEPDRKVAEQILAVFPHARQSARINRSFLRRAVQFMVEQGIDQFLDIGSGVPATGNVHEVAQALRPGARVVYVDIDPIAVAHGKSILQDNPDATMIQGDVRKPEAILDDPEALRLLDWSKPVGVLVLAVLHFMVDDAEAASVAATIRDCIAPGSCLALSHVTTEAIPEDVAARMVQVYATTNGLAFRPSATIQSFFEGFDLAEPGLVPSALWRPQNGDELSMDPSALSLALSAVGVKR